MGVYDRDGINYSSMLMAALKDRAETAARQAAYQERQGKLWGDTVKSVGNMVGRGIMASADSYGGSSDTTVEEDKAELKQLEEMQKKYDEQVEQRKKFDEIFNNPNYDTQAAQARIATNEMTGYNPVPQYMSNEATSYMEGYKPFYSRNYIPAQDGVWYDPEEQERMKREAAEAMNGYNPYYYSINGYYRRGR